MRDRANPVMTRYTLPCLESAEPGFGDGRGVADEKSRTQFHPKHTGIEQ